MSSAGFYKSIKSSQFFFCYFSISFTALQHNYVKAHIDYKSMDP